MFSKYASIVVIGIAVAGPASAATNYQSFVLLPVDGFNHDQVTGINDSGQIVGFSYSDSGAIKASLWSESTLRASALQGISGSVGDLALGINGSGQIIGRSDVGPPTGGTEAVVWSASTLPGMALEVAGRVGSSQAFGINASGQIVGDSTTNIHDSVAVVWSSTGTSTTLQDVGGFGFSEANAINRNGQIVGFSDTATGGTEAVLWSSSTRTGKALQDVGSPGTSLATGINNFGQIVGSSGPQAVLWSASTLTGMPLQNVGDAALSQANGINNLGQIVGFVQTAPSITTEAVVWSSSTGRGINLAPFLGSDWTDTEATAINDSGDIVGFGLFNHVVTGFLLIPRVGAPASAPEPSTWVLTLLGFGALGLVSYRQTRRLPSANSRVRQLE